jgi:phage baseplate assembly protein W
MAVATYKGFSTVNNTFGTVKLTDTDLIKRDLLNHFAIRKGEKLMNGNFGTSLRDLIMDPLTEQTKQVIVQEVNDVISTDPRVVPENVLIDEFDKGILIEMTLRYQITNQVETLQIRFDRSDETIS